MKKRIIPLFFLVLLLATVMIPTSAAISTKAISGKPTLKIEGTTAYCVGKYNSGNRNDAISITVTLMQGSKEKSLRIMLLCQIHISLNREL